MTDITEDRPLQPLEEPVEEPDEPETDDAAEQPVTDEPEE